VMESKAMTSAAAVVERYPASMQGNSAILTHSLSHSIVHSLTHYSLTHSLTHPILPTNRNHVANQNSQQHTT
jgi:hypothetical protein